MNYRLGSLFQRNAHSPARRLYFAWKRRVSALFGKRQSVRFVTINGKRYKRVTLGDSFEAEKIERAMLQARAPARFPRLIHRHENELLVRFVEGRSFEPGNPADREKVAEFLGALYAVAPQNGSPAPFSVRLATELEFLHDAGLIDAQLKRALAAKSTALVPASLLTGLDYVDPVAKNFVIDAEGVTAIDVESLRDGIPLGSGIAKAEMHWLEDRGIAEFVGQAEQAAELELAAQMDWVRLAFRVGWTKRKLLQGKHRFIRIERLRELVSDE